ncbi:MAG: hemin uptake protein HemP [Rhodocyclales bacterium]|nr:hemin uptake protein HemP [Rhodocyclales bacterium]
MKPEPPLRPLEAPRPAQGPRPLDSAQLFNGREEILIVHGNETYRLRRTRQGKLILTK